MKELVDAFSDFDAAVSSYRSVLSNEGRLRAAARLGSFPYMDVYSALARMVLLQTGASSVEVNAITATEQRTLVSVSDRGTRSAVTEVENSLCVLTTVATPNEGFQVSNVYATPMLTNHAVRTRRDDIGSWGSVPITVFGLHAGTVCVLDEEPRSWSDSEQAYMQKAARAIEAVVA